jgi:hypothetical protein
MKAKGLRGRTRMESRPFEASIGPTGGDTMISERIGGICANLRGKG